MAAPVEKLVTHLENVSIRGNKLSNFLQRCVEFDILQEGIIMAAYLQTDGSSLCEEYTSEENHWFLQDKYSNFAYQDGDIVFCIDVIRKYRSQPKQERSAFCAKFHLQYAKVQEIDAEVSKMDHIWNDANGSMPKPSKKNWIEILSQILLENFPSLLYYTPNGEDYKQVEEFELPPLPIMNKYTDWVGYLPEAPKFVFMIHKTDEEATEEVKIEVVNDVTMTDSKNDDDVTVKDNESESKSEVIDNDVTSAEGGTTVAMETDNDPVVKNEEKETDEKENMEVEEEVEKKAANNRGRSRKGKRKPRAKTTYTRKPTKKKLATPKVASTHFFFVRETALNAVMATNKQLKESVEKATSLMNETIAISNLGPLMLDVYNKKTGNDPEEEKVVRVDLGSKRQKKENGVAYTVNYYVDLNQAKYYLNCPKLFVSKERSVAEAFVQELRFQCTDEFAHTKYPPEKGCIETIWGSGLELMDVLTPSKRVQGFAWIYPRKQSDIPELNKEDAVDMVRQKIRENGGYNAVALQRDDEFPGSRLWGTVNFYNEYYLRNVTTNVNKNDSLPFVMLNKLEKQPVQRVHHPIEDYPFAMEFQWCNRATLTYKVTATFALADAIKADGEVFRQKCIDMESGGEGILNRRAETLIQDSILGEAEKDEAKKKNQDNVGKRRSKRVQSKKDSFAFHKSERCIMLDGSKNKFVKDLIQHGDADEVLKQLNEKLNGGLEEDAKEVIIDDLKFVPNPTAKKTKKKQPNEMIEIIYMIGNGMFSYVHKRHNKFVTEATAEILHDELNVLHKELNEHEDKGHEKNFEIYEPAGRGFKSKTVTLTLEQPDADEDRIDLERLKAALEDVIRNHNLHLTKEPEYVLDNASFARNRWMRNNFHYDVQRTIQRQFNNVDMQVRAQPCTNKTEFVYLTFYFMNYVEANDARNFLAGRDPNNQAPRFDNKKCIIDKPITYRPRTDDRIKKALMKEYFLNNLKLLEENYTLTIDTSRYQTIQDGVPLDYEAFQTFDKQYEDTPDATYYYNITVAIIGEQTVNVVLEALELYWEAKVINIEDWAHWEMLQTAYLKQYDSFCVITPNKDDKTVKIQASPKLRAEIAMKIESEMLETNVNILKILWEKSSTQEATIKAVLKELSPSYKEGEIATALTVHRVSLDEKRGYFGIFGKDQDLEHARAKMDQIAAKMGLPAISYCDPPVCSVCYAPLSEKPTENYQLQLCGHWYCLTCIEGNLRNFLSIRRTPITCVHEDCDEVILLSQLREICSKTDLKMDDLFEYATKSYIASHRTIVRYCPTPDCPYPYCVKAHAELFQCPGCDDVMICAACQAPWHEGLSCSVKRALKAVESKVVRWIEEDELNRKLCPKCHTGIEKMGGCNKMHCAQCDANICWVCLRTFPDANEAYAHISAEH